MTITTIKRDGGKVEHVIRIDRNEASMLFADGLSTLDGDSFGPVKTKCCGLAILQNQNSKKKYLEVYQ